LKKEEPRCRIISVVVKYEKTPQIKSTGGLQYEV